MVYGLNRIREFATPPMVGAKKVKSPPNVTKVSARSAATVIEIYRQALDGGAAISLSIDVTATRIYTNDCRRSLERVPGKNQVTTSRRKGHCRRSTGSTEHENIVADNHRTVASVALVQGEIEFRFLFVVSGKVTTPTAPRVALILRRIIDEDISRHHKIARLIDPRPTSAVAESVAGDDHVFARFLHADHSRTICSIDRIPRDRGILAILREEEGAHARASDVVVSEDDPATFLDVHGVAEGAQATAPDDDAFAPNEVDGALSRAAAR